MNIDTECLHAVGNVLFSDLRRLSFKTVQFLGGPVVLLLLLYYTTVL